MSKEAFEKARNNVRDVRVSDLELELSEARLLTLLLAHGSKAFQAEPEQLVRAFDLSLEGKKFFCSLEPQHCRGSNELSSIINKVLTDLQWPNGAANLPWIRICRFTHLVRVQALP